MKDGKFVFTQNGKEVFSGQLEIDAKKETLDFLNEDGKLLIPTIFGLNGDTLQLCIGAGDDRPTKFTAEKGTGQTITTYKRKK